MFILPSGSGAPGYAISNSLRFKASAGAYLARTPGTASNRKTWTWSGWVKRGAFSNHNIFTVHNNSNPDYLTFFTSSDLLQLNAVQFTSVQRIIAATTGVFRDTSAWYHIVLTVDTTQATPANGVRMWVNGVQQTLTFSAYTQNYDTAVNSTLVHYTGYWPFGGGGHLDGYLAEVHFVDGQALTPNDFGLTDSNGNWQPKAYTGTYGTNGFYLKFNNATSLTTLTQDSSGNSNNWTANNISLTAGATYDWMTDTPSNNFAVSNVLDVNRTDLTTSNGNLTLTKGASATAPRGASSIGVTAGKWYCEVTWASLTDSAPLANVYGTGVATADYWASGGSGADAVGYFAANAPSGLDGYKQIVTAGSAVNSTYGAGYFVNGTVIGIALDLTAGTVTFYKNGASQGAITLPTTSKAWFPYCISDGGNNAFTNHWNFGQRPFAYTPPAGFVTLCTANLPAPTIPNPRLHFDARTRVGTGASANITGYQFAPDFVWIKSRGRAVDHALYDRLRGVQVRLESNQTDAEVTSDNGLTAFNSDGYTLNTLDQVNGTTATNSFVDWAWKANGAGVSNNAGSISSTVSVNVAAGISLATYTGTGANATVGHGLGVAPKMVIVKRRNGTSAWPTRHVDIAAANSTYLNTTVGGQAAATVWNSTAPTSSVFSIGTSTDTNASGGTYVAYCFAEVPGFSRIGSYVGNGSTDGPFVYCGFRPRWVLIKSGTVSQTWVLVDAQRSNTNVVNATLYPNEAVTENFSAIAQMDFTANGFKIRALDATVNIILEPYIFLAFAEAPFKSARAR